MRTSPLKSSTKFAAKLVTPLRARRSALVPRWLPHPVPREVHAYSTSVTVSRTPSVEYMEPTRGRETLVREGANADERASPKGSEQKHPRVGARALLQQRDVLGGHGLPRRGGHLLRAQRQGQRHSALHLRAARRPEDSRGRRGCRLAGVESPTSKNFPSTYSGEYPRVDFAPTMGLRYDRGDDNRGEHGERSGRRRGDGREGVGGRAAHRRYRGHYCYPC